MNYTGLVLVGVGSLAVVIAIKNTQNKFFDAVTGQNTSAKNGSTNGGGANFVPSTNNPIASGIPGLSGLRLTAYQDAVSAKINPTHFIKQIQAESGFNPTAISPVGAQGIAQFMPATAAGLGINPWDAQSALSGAAKYMANLIKQFGGEAEALAAYNAGGGTVATAKRNAQRYGEDWRILLPIETQNYLNFILG